MKKIKNISFILILVIFIGISDISDGKYILKQTNIVANINIDRTLPKIELISIKDIINKYKNNTHTIIVQIKVIEKNIKTNKFNTENVKTLIEEQEINEKQMEIKQVDIKNDYIIYEVILKDINDNVNLKIKIPEYTIIDNSNNTNEEKIIYIK
ncbi:MAG: hypothetical protein HFJ40_06550 [Clostridia bacterium]|nr:hypothetical protein [Clostridia bacterium]